MLGRSRALNYVKRLSKIRCIALEDAIEAPEDALPLEQAVLMDDEKKALYKALAALKPDQKEVVILVYFEDMSCQEVAGVLKKNVKQVYNLLYRAKEALRTILEQEGVFRL